MLVSVTVNAIFGNPHDLLFLLVFSGGAALFGVAVSMATNLGDCKLYAKALQIANEPQSRIMIYPALKEFKIVGPSNRKATIPFEILNDCHLLRIEKGTAHDITMRDLIYAINNI